VPTLKDIKRRIASVKKTQQITSAMRMVAAAKLRRAEAAIKAARPYAERMRQTLGEVAAALGDAEHPLLVARNEVHSLEVVVITSDRGLCGAFNSSAIKKAEALIAERRHGLDNIAITTIGRKASEHFARRHSSSLAQSYEIGKGWIEYDWAAQISRRLSQRYRDAEVDQVIVVVNRFESVMRQTAAADVLLPFQPPESDMAEAEGEGAERLPYSIEPSPEQLLGTLVPKAVEVEIFRALLENQVGEHAARMTAMESATRNTEDLIEQLTLQYNRARQAAITKELVEIVSGAEAL
jgi:F-type H+-transporting ATPase subunit gamma